jgi:hypothetical protein
MFTGQDRPCSFFFGAIDCLDHGSDSRLLFEVALADHGPPCEKAKGQPQHCPLRQTALLH